MHSNLMQICLTQMATLLPLSKKERFVVVVLILVPIAECRALLPPLLQTQSRRDIL